MTNHTWNFEIQLLPGSPGPEKLLPVFRLLVGDDQLLDARELDSTKLDMDDRAAFLAEQYPIYQSRSNKGHLLFVYGPGDSYVSVDFSLDPAGGGVISGHLGSTTGAVVEERVARLVDELWAPFAAISVGPRERSIVGRMNTHREAARRELGEAVFPFWIKWGLPGLAYRTSLGQPIVEMVSEERLRALGDELAWPEGGHWVVAGSATPEDWSYDPPGEQERYLIEHLGPQHFFDIGSRRLPTELPQLPAFPPYPVTYRDPGSGELVTTVPA